MKKIIITAYRIKSVINQEIIKAVKEGIKSLSNFPVRSFLDCLTKFNKERNRARSARLINIEISKYNQKSHKALKNCNDYNTFELFKSPYMLPLFIP